MSNNKIMTYAEFKSIYESLGLKPRDVFNITGKQRNTLEKWAQEDVVKDPSTATLFRLAETLREEPHFYTVKDIVSLLQQSAGVKLESIEPLDEEELKVQMINRLKSMMSKLEK